MSDTENVPAPRQGGEPADPAGPAAVTDPADAADPAVTDPADAADPTDESLDLLTVSEVAAMLRLSKMTIYRLMDKGSLPALRVGRSFRIPRDSVRSLVEESARQA